LESRIKKRGPEKIKKQFSLVGGRGEKPRDGRQKIQEGSRSPPELIYQVGVGGTKSLQEQNENVGPGAPPAPTIKTVKYSPIVRERGA